MIPPPDDFPLPTISRKAADRGRFFDARPPVVQQILRTRDPKVLVCGPLGCVAGETRLYDPITGESPTFLDLFKQGLRPTVQTLNGPVLATVPFRKGHNKLYRVRTGTGRSFLATADHRVLTPRGWTAVSSVYQNELIAISQPCPRASNSESDQLSYLGGVPRSTHTRRDYQDRCLMGYRHDGEQLHRSSNTCRFSAPSRDGVLEHNRGYQRVDVQEFSQGYIHHNPSLGHRAIDGYSPSFFATAHSVFDAHAGILAPSAASCLFASQSQTCLSQLKPFPSRSRCVDSKPHSYFRSVSNLAVSGTACWDRVVSITYERTDEYFDLHVPGEENYLAEGVFHHNTGKTRAALEKCRGALLKYPGARGLLLRSVRKWMTNSALVTWEEKVVLKEELVPDKIRRDHRSEYRFRNGSTLVVAGLDDPVAVRSSDYDFAFILEATEVSREAVEEVEGRLRYGLMPYQFLLMDCNPGPPTHWLKQDADAGKLTYIDTRHRDNPFLFNQGTGQWTRIGEQYMTRLENLTGSRRLRLRDGKWVQAEGVVYENWDITVHAVGAFPIPAHWSRYLSIDFGFTNPMVWQWWALDDDDRAHLYREFYCTQWLVEDVCKLVKDNNWWGDPRPRELICDHDAEGRATIERHLEVSTTPANKAVTAGIQDLDARLRAAGDGKPRLFVHRGALIHEPDDLLRDQQKPTSTLDEFDAYVWDPKAKKGEQPLKQNDHGMDAARYFAAHVAEHNPQATRGFYE